MADFQDQKKVVDVTLFLRLFRPYFFYLFFSFKKKKFWPVFNPDSNSGSRSGFESRIRIRNRIHPDPKPDPNPKLTKGRIRIRIRNKSFGSATLFHRCCSMFIQGFRTRINLSCRIRIQVHILNTDPDLNSK